MTKENVQVLARYREKGKCGEERVCVVGRELSLRVEAEHARLSSCSSWRCVDPGLDRVQPS
jgi:hypothetical protein